jgi:nicotinate-nucleotide pyrophosphorylase (carboxylating)
VPASSPFDAMVARALEEDLRTGDRTSLATVPEGVVGRGHIVAREALVLSGIEAAASCFRQVDAEVSFLGLMIEGGSAAAGTNVIEVHGSLRSLLAAERCALNFLQRASGIATRTRRCVDLVEGTGVDILDTRKTAPGLRLLDKAAVRAGGGVNHRFALDDLLMVKDNHVVAAGGLAAAVTSALEGAGAELEVEVEVDTLEQLRELLALPALPATVLLDNFDAARIREAVALIASRMSVEVSGGVTEENLRELAEAGPDAISLGALTHSVRAADLAMDLVPLPGNATPT